GHGPSSGEVGRIGSGSATDEWHDGHAERVALDHEGLEIPVLVVDGDLRSEPYSSTTSRQSCTEVGVLSCEERFVHTPDGLVVGATDDEVAGRECGDVAASPGSHLAVSPPAIDEDAPMSMPDSGLP